MRRKIKSIKEDYLPEFIKHRASQIKSEIRHLCILSICVYFLATIMSFVIIPRSFNPEEIPILKFLILSSLLIFLFIPRIHTFSLVKIQIYLYTIALLYVLTSVHLIYPRSIPFSPTSYIFLFFLISFTVSCPPKGLILLFVLHIFAYNSLYMYTHRYLPEQIKASFGPIYYLGGFIFLCMGFVLSYAVRKKLAQKEVENFVLLKEVEERSSQMEKELRLATRIHETLMPSEIKNKFLDIDMVYLPLSYISGDYARFYFYDEDLVMFIVCDVTGHGVSAALLVNRLHIEFMRLARRNKEPGELLGELNGFIVREFGASNMYLSVFCGLIDIKHKQLLYSNDGHPTQYVYRNKEARLVHMPAQKILLGLDDKPGKVFQGWVELGAGDRIVLFTDGIADVENKNGEQYKKERMTSFIMNNPSLNAKSFNAQLLEDVKAFKAGAFKDDIFLMNIFIKAM